MMRGTSMARSRSTLLIIAPVELIDVTANESTNWAPLSSAENRFCFAQSFRWFLYMVKKFLRVIRCIKELLGGDWYVNKDMFKGESTGKQIVDEYRRKKCSPQGILVYLTVI
jgi:hypothetical protein